MVPLRALYSLRLTVSIEITPNRILIGFAYTCKVIDIEIDRHFKQTDRADK